MNNQYLKIALKAAKKAGEVLLENFRKDKKVEIKSGKVNIVTQADKKSERAILDIIQKEFPDHKIFSEEVGFLDSSSDYYWIIDPLDGTNPYSCGQFHFGVSIALLHKYEPFLGVIYLPVFREMFWAQKGKGAFLNGKRICVSRTKKLIEAQLAIDYAYKNRKKNIMATYELAEETRRIYIYSSSSFALASVACGRLDGHFHNAVPGVYDVAAGTLLVQEAGGKVTDWEGNPIDWRKKRNIQFLATNNRIHSQILRVLKKKK